jgi:hypothetical protein
MPVQGHDRCDAEHRMTLLSDADTDSANLARLCGWCHTVQNVPAAALPEGCANTTYTICPLCLSRYFDSTTGLAQSVVVGNVTNAMLRSMNQSRIVLPD